MPKKDYYIKDKDSAMEFCNKLMAYVNSDNFVPFNVEADFGKGSSDPQRKYYWSVIIETQYQYFKNDVLRFTTWLYKALRAGALDRQLIHEVNKLLYNNGRSSERLVTDKREEYHDKITSDMYHICEVNTPKPNEVDYDDKRG